MSKGGKKSAAPADETLSAVALEVTSIPTLVLTLQSTEVDVLGKTCDALEAYASKGEKNIETVVHANAVEPLCNLLVSEDLGVKHRASLCLSTLCQSLTARLALKGSLTDTLIQNMLPLTTAGAPAVGQENAMATFAHLSKNFSFRRNLLAGGVIPAACELLSSTTPTLLKAVLECLLALAQDYKSRNAIADVAPYAALLPHLSSDYREIQELGIQLVALIATSELCRHGLYDAGVLQLLISHVANQDFKPTHEPALRALSSMLHEPQALERIGTPPADGSQPPLEMLVGFLKSTDVAVKIEALNCIRVASFSAENRRLLTAYSSELAVVAQLTPDDPKQPVNVQLSLAATATLTSLAASKTSAQIVAGSDVYARLLKLSSHDDPTLVASAVESTAVLLASNPKAATRAIEVGFYPRLLQLLATTEPEHAESRMQATSCLASISSNSDNITTFEAQSPVEFLVRTVTNTKALLDHVEYALASLANLTQHTQFLEEFKRLAPFDAISQRVNTRHDGVRRAAARLVATLSADPPIAAALFHSGILEPLQDVARSLPHSSASITSAINSVLDSNLSAKYAMQDRLTASDKITSLFYDVGKLPATQNVPPLSSLFELPISHQRAYILVNIAGVTSEPAANLASIPTDPKLISLVEHATNSLAGLEPQSKITRLAELVAQRMGGALSTQQQKQTFFQLEFAELKMDLESCVIPIGSVTRSGMTHRALLFKVLADQVGIGSELVRGDFGRAYNVVYTPECHVVDVTMEPGRLFRVPSANHLKTHDPFI
eukprot:m.81866 g.81866  ORF g.81866 m.81866 type:complete len:782 (+) comp12657_c0_seq6:332-2677(+)